MDKKENEVHLILEGGLSFLSTAKISKLQKEIFLQFQSSSIIVDLSNIKNVDSSGAAALVEFYQQCQSQNIPFYIIGLSKKFESMFEITGGKQLLQVPSNEL